MNRNAASTARKIINRDLRKDNYSLREKLTFAVKSYKRNFEIQQKLNNIGSLVIRSKDLESLICETAEALKSEFGLSAATFCLENRFKDILGEMEPTRDGAPNGAAGLLKPVFEKLFFLGGDPLTEFFGPDPKPALRGGLEHGSVDHFGFRFYRRIRSEAIVPLCYMGECFGTLNLGSNNPAKYKGGVPTDLLEQLSNIISLSIANMELRSKVL
jgi:uncharacterized protein YigA (DUF484 family)